MKQKKTCPCFSGTGVQYNNKMGVRVLCPACSGKGVIEE